MPTHCQLSSSSVLQMPPPHGRTLHRSLSAFPLPPHPSSQRRRGLHRNFPLPPPSYPPSDGVGLVSVKHAVALVGGLVWLTADSMHTTFHLKLPAEPAPDEDGKDNACTGVDRPAAATAATTAAATTTATTA